MKATNIRNTSLLESDLRFDAEFHLSEGVKTIKLIKRCPYEVLTLKDVASDIFYGGRSKRAYVAAPERGVPFMGSADMLDRRFISLKYVSSKNTANLDDSLIHPNWILISRSGTIGNTVFSNKNFINKAASEHIIRVVPNNEMKPGTLYAFLASKYGYSLMTQGTFGAVIQHIEPDFLSQLPVPNFPKALQNKVNEKVMNASLLREEANALLVASEKQLYKSANLRPLSKNDYEYFGVHSNTRKPSTFNVSSKSLDSTTINAFNYSEKIRRLIKNVQDSVDCVPLQDVLENGSFFSTGSFPRLEIDSPKSIKLINQTDIFNVKMKGKLIARKRVKVDSLVEYGEVLIAGVGTLGENETFCRVVFGGEELQGQLVSGEFIRMKSRNIPAGYLFTWLSSEHGFRLLRSTQSGTKLCRPIHKLLYKLPVPLLDRKLMNEIHKNVLLAHSKMSKAAELEKNAIELIENEISTWQR